MEQVVLSFVAGLASAVLTQWTIYLFDRRKSRRKSNHLALRLANEFERFAEKCMSSIFDNRNTWEASHNPDRQETSLPGPPQLFDEDLGWETLNRVLAADILGFRHAIDYAGGKVADEFMFGMPAGAWIVRDDEAVTLGVKAISIAERLRLEHGQHGSSVAWDYRSHLRKECARIEREKIAFQTQRLADRPADTESKAPPAS